MIKRRISGINREILKIALPAIATNVTTPLLGLVDIAIVGHFGSSTYLAAIAVGSSMFNMIYWLLNFLRMGSSGLTAQAVGREDIRSRDIIFWRAFLTGILLGVAVLALSPLLSRLIIPFMEADAPTSDLAGKYFMWAVLGAPAYIGLYAVTGWLIGCQNSAATLKIALVTNVANILLSLTFVGLFRMKMEGVAMGTALSQWIGLAAGLYIIRKKYRPRLPRRAELLNLKDLMAFGKINVDIFFRTLCLVGVTVWFTRAGAKQGSDILAANAILMQFFMLFSFFMDGFAFSGEALSGKFYGAGNRELLTKIEKVLMKWGLGMSIAGMLVYFFGGEIILKLLTDEESVRAMAGEYMMWAVTIPMFGFMAFIYDGIFIGLTLTRKMLVSMFCSMGVFFLLYFLLVGKMGNNALWLAFSCYLLTRGIVQFILLRRWGVRNESLGN